MREKLTPPAHFIRQLRPTPIQREVLARMCDGDYLKLYNSGVVMLHTADPLKRNSEKLTPGTLDSLERKGLIVRDRERSDDGGAVYALTEDGETAARILRRGDLDLPVRKDGNSLASQGRVRLGQTSAFHFRKGPHKGTPRIRHRRYF